MSVFGAFGVVVAYLAIGVVAIRIARHLEGGGPTVDEGDRFVEGLVAIMWPAMAVFGAILGLVWLVGRVASPPPRKGDS